MRALRWYLFCRVIDNHGDLGVCWRLAADLAARGDRVELWVDDPSALAWMAPGGAPGVHAVGWSDEAAARLADAGCDLGDVVVEAFGCDPPPAFVARMAAARRVAPADAQVPAWINLEYLSAEPYVERCHTLPSPQSSGPGAGLMKHFYYPGFTPHTGGLLRERGLMAERRRFDRAAWQAAHGVTVRPGERVVSLFCYPDAPVALLPAALAAAPTLLLLTPGAARRVAAMALPSGVRTQALPWLTQTDYDRLLWGCDLNFVRGEDSAVRAMWAGVPFVWQLYPQHDGAHATKLEAFLARHTAGADAATAHAVRRLHGAWNGLTPWPQPPATVWPAWPAWAACCEHWRSELLALPDLATELRGFAIARLTRSAAQPDAHRHGDVE